MSWLRTPKILTSSSFRFAMLTVGVIWLSTALVLVAVYMQLDRAIWRSIDASLDLQTTELLQQAKQTPSLSTEELLAAYNAQLNSSQAIASSGADSMQQMHNSPAMHAMHQAMGLAQPPARFLAEHHRMLAVNGALQVARSVELPNGEAVELSQNVAYLTDLQTSLWQSLLFGLAITLGIALLGSLVLTQRSLRRIHQINRSCQAIMAGDLAHRIPYQKALDARADAKPQLGTLDDYDQMAWHINQMLDALHDAMAKARQVSDNIAHDLKSPLARIRVKLESAYEQQPSIEVEDSMQELDRVLAMTKSLLGIARIESKTRAGFAPVSVRELLQDVQEMYGPVFDEQGIEFSVEPNDQTLAGDKHLLMQALTNLLDNAHNHTPTHGSVSLLATAERGVDGSAGVQWQIQDSGPGIDKAEFTKVFERFYRQDEARQSGGFGLGLSLVQSIIQLHGGTVELSNNAGLRVDIWLPAGV